MSEVMYRIYPTLLDSWTYFRESEMTEEAFLDRVNGREEAGEAALKGTAFNAVVDALCDGLPVPEEMQEDGMRLYVGEARDKAGAGWQFRFPAPLAELFAELYRDALRQQYLSFEADTPAGRVLFYGYADGVFPDCVADIKTTAKYHKRGEGSNETANKYRKRWQPYVYLHALAQSGCRPAYFRFDITDFRDVWQEVYRMEDFPIGELLSETAALCRWLEERKELIVKPKLFNCRYEID